MILALALSSVVSAAEVSVAARGHAMNPVWSADGQWVAFELNPYQGQNDLYVIKIVNGNPVGTPQKVALPGSSSQFGGTGNTASAPTWLPQGQVVFEGTTGGKGRLFLWKPGGAAAGELLSTTQVSGELSWPTVSPDGKALTFVSDVTGSGDIYSWDRASNQVKMLFTSPFSEAGPRYSDDSQKMAYSRKNQGGEDLFVYAATQSSPLMGGNGDQTRPVFVGEKVVYFTNERGGEHWDIAAVTGPGTKVTVAKDVRLPLRAAPALTPDKQWVVYGMDIPAEASKIRFTSVDGSKTVAYDTGLVAVGDPSVTKVGDRLYLAFTALPSAGADWRQLHVVDVTDTVK